MHRGEIAPYRHITGLMRMIVAIFWIENVHFNSGCSIRMHARTHTTHSRTHVDTQAQAQARKRTQKHTATHVHT